MAENLTWSTGIGRWMGIPVRIHLFLILFVALIFGAEWNPGNANNNLLFGTAMVTTLILIGSIIIHELAHIYTACSLGGHFNSIVLTPWGGSSDLILPAGNQARTITHLAGPLSNGLVFLLCTSMLYQAEEPSFSSLVHPLQPHWFNPLLWQKSMVYITCWVNFQLMVINLLPCFPFDGAAILRSVVHSLNVGLPNYRIESGVKLIGNTVAFAMFGMAYFFRHYESTAPGLIQPSWLAFLLFGIVLLYCAKYSYQMECVVDEAEWDDVDDLEYDSLYSEASFFEFGSETENSAYSQWLSEKQEARRMLEEKREEEEDRLADEILIKVQNDGISSLTQEEKSLLDRVSSRIRRRRQQSVLDDTI
ncbi:MAG: site-2 protease family protein [Planctomycetota bacterium]